VRHGQLMDRVRERQDLILQVQQLLVLLLLELDGLPLLRGDHLTLLVGAVCWNVVTFALYGLLMWIVPRLLVPAYVLALVAILGVPLVRLSAAPLAFAWNRNR